MAQGYTLKPLEWKEYGDDGNEYYAETMCGNVYIDATVDKSSWECYAENGFFYSHLSKTLADAKASVQKHVHDYIIAAALSPIVDPLDDTTPITDEWLNSLPGYRKHPSWDEWMSLQYSDALTVEKEQDGDETWYWIDGLSNDVREFRIKTRGQLRTAFKLFGVPMQEKSNP